MKPGKPLQRRTPLRQGTTQLRRTPLQPGTTQLRRTPISPVSRKRQRENRQRVVVVDAMRLLAEGRCARCGRADLPVHGHERRGRAQGASIIAPECLLDPICNGWCEDNPQLAAWTGWKVSPKWPHDPQLGIGEAFDVHGNRVIFADYTTQEASA